MPETVEKKIAFYRGRFLKDNAVIDPLRLFARLESIPQTDSRRYCPRDDGNSIAMLVHRRTFPIRGCMGVIRQTNLPLGFNLSTGSASPLDLVDADGLYEPTHFVIFPMIDGYNIIGIEQTGYGPRPSALRLYLTTTLSNYIDDLDLTHIVRRDVSEMISRIGQVNTFTLAISRDLDAELDALGRNSRRMFNLMKSDFPDTQYFKITLKPEKYSRAGIRIPILDRLAHWVSDENVRPKLDAVKIEGRNINDEKEDFDLLDPYLLAKKQVVKEMEGYRCVDSTDMFIKIEDSYREMSTEINRILTSGQS